MDSTELFSYRLSAAFPQKVAYFCMEYAIHQPLKTYAGGLGFLAGSQLRSAYELGMPMIGIGILWKYGYYDQVRKEDQSMSVLYQEKIYGFLKDTGLRFNIKVAGHQIAVAAYFLPPETFKTAPLFFLSTDLPENDYLSRTICHRLYDSNPETKIAVAILLGVGGSRLLDLLNWTPDYYHLNESHGLPLAFELYEKWQDLDEVRKRLVFTNHTPEPGGNEKTPIASLNNMGFFGNLSIEQVRDITCLRNAVLDHTLSALRLAGRANGVSQLHGAYLCRSRGLESNTCPIISITNAQSFSYWHHAGMYRALYADDDAGLVNEKRKCKEALFEEVADQCGEIYDPTVLTIVFAKRFGGYKRPELLLKNLDRLHKLLTNNKYPIQIIWAGKPYPQDNSAIAIFNGISQLGKSYPNVAALTGYELSLSRLLKQGADIWLNVPRMTHEASGTSGMSAAMNGAVNLSIPDGWFPEFVRDGVNGFIIPASDPGAPEHEQDAIDANSLYDILEHQVIPLYYEEPGRWIAIQKQGMRDILPFFDSHRMAREYYEKLYVSKEPAAG
jgi:starch phosphorylase